MSAARHERSTGSRLTSAAETAPLLTDRKGRVATASTRLSQWTRPASPSQRSTASWSWPAKRKRARASQRFTIIPASSRGRSAAWRLRAGRDTTVAAHEPQRSTPNSLGGPPERLKRLVSANSPAGNRAAQLLGPVHELPRSRSRDPETMAVVSGAACSRACSSLTHSCACERRRPIRIDQTNAVSSTTTTPAANNPTITITTLFFYSTDQQIRTERRSR